MPSKEVDSKFGQGQEVSECLGNEELVSFGGRLIACDSAKRDPDCGSLKWKSP